MYWLRRAPAHTPAQRLALEIHAVVDRMDRDRPFVMEAWNAWRERQPLLDALASSWEGWPTDALLDLDEHALIAVDAFFDELARATTWARTTDAMPATLEARYEAAQLRLGQLADAALHALGGLPPT